MTKVTGKYMQVIGPKLKKARLRKSLSLEEISERTRIHINNLTRLENGEWGFLPDVYLRGMLQQFADIVGVDVSEFLKKQAVQTDKTMAPPKMQIAEPLESALTVSTKSLVNLDKATVSRYTPYFGVAGFVCIIALLLIFKPFSQSNEPAVYEPVMVEQTPAISTQLKPLEATAQDELLTLSLKATRETWLKVAADDSLPYEYVLRNGQVKNWQALNKFNLRIGNPGAVEFRLNNQLLSFPGDPNQVTTLVITENGMSIQ